MIGVLQGPPPDGAEAVLIALKSRTCPAGAAVRDSLLALEFLRLAGVRQVYFKYCSTFDSTADGNIGPVADALLDALDTTFTVVCPTFPANGRTVYKGTLFAGDVRFDESSMRNHSLTPMTDANLVRLMQRQTWRKVGLVDHGTIRSGTAAIRERFEMLGRDGVAYAVTDVLTEADLVCIGAACAGLPLLTAGSGMALGIAPNLRDPAAPGHGAGVLPPTGGRRAVIAGSCSAATRRQVDLMRRSRPAFQVAVADIARRRRGGAGR